MEEKADNLKEQELKELENIKNAINERGFNYETQIAKGSFGRVVQAFHLVDELRYAIKVLPDTENTEKYNEREVNFLAKADLWKHNIVKYYCPWKIAIGNDRFLCIQMELCRVNLQAFVYKNDMGGVEIIKSNGPPRFYRHVFSQILNGLAAMHSIGWVHRDIHISNILIANPKPTAIGEIHIKIADFGLAREIRPVIDASTSLSDAPKLQKLSSGVGNELFRAPELATEHYDYKVDLFSAGIVLYFLNRYLEDKDQWKDEILQLRQGNRNYKHLYHRDDERLTRLFNLLLQEEPSKRPTAEKALEIIQSRQSTKTPTESTDSGTREETKTFLIKTTGEKAWTRCTTNDDTLSSLQENIENCIGVRVDSQVLHQKTTIDGVEDLIKITNDLDVRVMFQSAETTGKKVTIIVSENDSEMDVEEVGLPEAVEVLSKNEDHIFSS